jgi:hypothetical protein
MPSLPPGFETLEAIQKRLDSSPIELPKAYLIAIWRSVPDDTRSQLSLIHTDEMLKIYNEFIRTCGKDSIVWEFENAIKDKADCYPWQVPLHSEHGYNWARIMAIAALELPAFIDKTYASMEDRFSMVKEEVKQKVTGEGKWLQRLNDAFEKARGHSLLVSKRT